MKFDVIIIGGGLAGMTAALKLQQAGMHCAVVSEGLSLSPVPLNEFLQAGGVMLQGDSVTGGLISGGLLRSVQTRNLVGTVMEADNFILATGKFFSKGLIATMNRIYEPIFDCDVRYPASREDWVNRDFHADQPFEHFGVLTDSRGHVSIKGEIIGNLYAAGEIMAGAPDICASASDVVEDILGK